MTNAILSIRALQRPVTLIRAARHLAAERPSRNRLNARVLRGQTMPSTCLVAARIEEREAELEAQRIATDPSYAPQAHVEALAALMLAAAEAAGQAKASGSASFRLATKSSNDSRTAASMGGAS